jgi:hypothetical protein
MLVNNNEYLQLLAEKTALERMIAETPEEDVLDRASLSARLKSIEDALSQAKPDEPEPKHDKVDVGLLYDQPQDHLALARLFLRTGMEESLDHLLDLPVVTRSG